jgi:ribosome-associated protein
MQTVIINREPVELFKLLKFEGLVSSGGEAKVMVANGMVKLNGQIELQKRKKVVSGDVIEFNGQSMTLELEIE